MKRKHIDIEITKLFMFKAGKKDWKRRFMGSIREGVDNAGNTVVCGQVEVNECTIYAQAPDQEQLGEQIDEMVLLVLDYGLHSTAGKEVKICDADFSLN